MSRSHWTVTCVSWPRQLSFRKKVSERPAPVLSFEVPDGENSTFPGVPVNMTGSGGWANPISDDSEWRGSCDVTVLPTIGRSVIIRCSKSIGPEIFRKRLDFLASTSLSSMTRFGPAED
eukprot:3935909-Rhodomonas_salina.1